jgi:Ca-activated chloride channel family protein
MSFSTPLALVALLVVPILLGAYLWQLRRKRKQAVKFSNVALVRTALPKRSQWRRHVPIALFLLALGGLVLAAARPQLSSTVPIGRTSIILTLDVSRSMCSTDVVPNRLTAAQEAAKSFVKDQPKGTRIGIVAFAGFPELVIPPTTNKSQLNDAINNLTTSGGTVIGAAELKALDAIASVNPNVAPVDASIESNSTSNTLPDAGSTPTTEAPSTSPAPPKGGYVPDIIVLLTDGANTRGISPVDAAQQAVDRKVRIYTIGFGTTNPAPLVCSSQQLGAGGFFDGNGFGGGGGAFPPGGGGFVGGGGNLSRFLDMDEATLRQVAQMTGGTFYHAEAASQLKSVFANLPNQITLQKETHEISVVFAIIGALLAIAAVGLSLLWNRSP